MTGKKWEYFSRVGTKDDPNIWSTKIGSQCNVDAKEC